MRYPSVYRKWRHLDDSCKLSVPDVGRFVVEMSHSDTPGPRQKFPVGFGVAMATVGCDPTNLSASTPRSHRSIIIDKLSINQRWYSKRVDIVAADAHRWRCWCPAIGWEVVIFRIFRWNVGRLSLASSGDNTKNEGNDWMNENSWPLRVKQKCIFLLYCPIDWRENRNLKNWNLTKLKISRMSWGGSLGHHQMSNLMNPEKWSK